MEITPPRALHVDGSNCSDRLTSLGFTGTVTADNISLTFTGLDGEVVTFIGNLTNAPFTGIYSMDGGAPPATIAN